MQLSKDCVGGLLQFIRILGLLPLHALTALPAQSSSGIKALQSSLPQWLSQAQRYLNSVARAGSARLPQPPVGAASAVQEAASAAAKALRPPGERETIKPARTESEVGELAELEQQRKYADKLQKAADAILRQLHLFPHLRGKMEKLIAKAARSAGINPDHLARAVQARVSQMTAGATGGVRASGGKSSLSANRPAHETRDLQSILEDELQLIELAEALKNWQGIQQTPSNLVGLQLLANAALFPGQISPGKLALVPTSLSTEPLANIVRNAANGKKTIVLYTPSSAEELSSINDPNILLVKYSVNSSIENVKKFVLDIPDINSYQNIIAVGGGTVQDAARLAVTLGTKTADVIIESYVGTVSSRVQNLIRQTANFQINPNISIINIPTTIGTTSQATGITIDKTESGVLRTPQPTQIIIPLHKIRPADALPGLVDRIVGGFGQKAVEAVLLDKRPTQYLQKTAPTEFQVIDWMNARPDFKQWSVDEKLQLLKLLGFWQTTYAIPKLNAAGKIEKPNGFEHDLYYAFARMPVGKNLPHGVWVGLGSLIELQGIANLTRDQTPLNMMKKFLKKLGAPINYNQLSVLGITRNDLMHAMEKSIDMVRQSGRKTVMIPLITNAGGSFDAEKTGTLLDQVFNAD